MSTGALLNGNFGRQCFLLWCISQITVDTFSREQAKQMQVSVCVCVYLCICFCVFVVTLHRCPARRCQKPAIGNTFDLQMKKKHTRTFPKIDTPTVHTDTGVCVSRGDDLQLNRRVVGRLRSFLQNTSRGNTSVYSPRTRHLPVLFLVINRRQ